jgi:hypothetical protein
MAPRRKLPDEDIESEMICDTDSDEYVADTDSEENVIISVTSSFLLTTHHILPFSVELCFILSSNT